MDRGEIRFEHECLDGLVIEVIANDDATDLCLYLKDTSDVVPIWDLARIDQDHVIMMIEAWRDHLKFMNEPRPENEAFNESYVEWLNKEMGKK